MRLDLRVGLRDCRPSRSVQPDVVELPVPMLAYGSPEFRATRVVVNARAADLAERSFVWVVAGFAHELAHVASSAIAHRLRHDERAVDLTAMALGYQAFVGDAEITRSEGLLWSIALSVLLLPLGVLVWRTPKRRTLRLGYRRAAKPPHVNIWPNGRARRSAGRQRRAWARFTRLWGSSPRSAGLAGAGSSGAPAAGLPLKVSAPCDTPILTVSPSLISPASSICASGSCTVFWITRFSGRAP